MEDYRLKTNVYIDGFNLFYGCLKKTNYKWLDVYKLLVLYFPRYHIQSIKYFSALTKARKNDLDKPVRQAMYYRALLTLPNLEIISGTFLENEVVMYVPQDSKLYGRQKARVEFKHTSASLPLFGDNYLTVKKTEEKGSDVNLATHLLIDAYSRNFEVAIVVSNDSDLASPIVVVNKMSGLAVRLLNPYNKTNNKLREAVCGNIKTIRTRALGAAQFPKEMKDKHGYFHRPDVWG